MKACQQTEGTRSTGSDILMILSSCCALCEAILIMPCRSLVLAGLTMCGPSRCCAGTAGSSSRWVGVRAGVILAAAFSTQTRLPGPHRYCLPHSLLLIRLRPSYSLLLAPLSICPLAPGPCPQVLDIASMSVFLFAMDCQYFDSPSGGQQFYNQEFPQ